MIQAIPDQLIQSATSAEKLAAFLKDRQFPIVEGDFVTFVYHGKADHVNLKHWICGLPSSIPLKQVEHTDLWFRTLEFPGDSRIEYKFGVTQGDHERWLHDPLNANVALDPFGGNSVIRTSGFQEPEWTRPRNGIPHGRLEQFQIQSKSLGDTRNVGVYLPASFRPYRRYRLLVVHDGDDYIRYSQLNTVLDNLIEDLEIPPLIVALSNPHQRLVEYANDPGHAEHVVKELLPELQERYPIIDQASGRCLMGASFGGVASLATAWRYPEAFGSLLLQSGSFAFTDIGDHSRSKVFDQVVEFMNAFRKEPGMPVKKAFISCGVYESLIYENRSLVPFLLKLGVKVKFKESRDGHNWENWRDQLRDGLTWLFPGPLWMTYM